MAQEAAFTPQGLFSDSGAISAPDGALRQADNVVIRTAGVVESREAITTINSLAGFPAEHLAPFRGEGVVFALEHPTSAAITNVVCTNGAVVAGNVIAAGTIGAMEDYRPPSGYYTKTVEDRGSLYYTARTGLRKIATPNQTGDILAGLLPAPTPEVVTGATLVVSGDYYYRTVVRRTDANNYIARSAPSAPVFYDNNSSRRAVLTQIVRDYQAGDVVEIYRTPRDVLSDELQLSTEFELTASHIAAGLVAIKDSTPDGGLRATIYTAQSQEGVLQRNDPPPQGRDVALYQDSVFFANTGHAYETFITLSAPDTELGGRVRPGFHSQTNGLKVVSGTAVVSITANGQSMSRGMGIVAASAWTGIASIVSFNESTSVPSVFRMSKVSTLTGTVDTWTYHDSVKLGAENFFAGHTTGFVITGWGMSTAANYMVGIVHGINRTSTNYRAEPLFVVGGSNVEYPTVRVFAKNANITATTARVTPDVGGASGISPAVPRYVNWNNKQFFGWKPVEPLTADYRPNRIMWSKPRQPEATPRVNEAYVGSENYPILRILATRDALFIFKQDGVWTLTGEQGSGSFPPGWNLRPFDPTLSLLSPEAVTVFNDRIYGWFSQGFHVVTMGGKADVSVGRIDDQIRSIQLQLARGDRLSKRAIMVGHSAYDNEVYLLMPDALPETGGAQYVFVWNDETQTWVRWTGIAADSVADMPGIAGPLFSYSNGNLGYLSTTSTGRTKPTSVTSVVELRGKSSRNPTVKKRWQEAHAIFDDADPVTSVTASFTSSEDDAAVTATETFASRSNDNSRSIRFRVPKNHSRASEIYPKVTVAGGAWKMTGIGLTYYPYSTRTTR